MDMGSEPDLGSRLKEAGLGFWSQEPWRRCWDTIQGIRAAYLYRQKSAPDNFPTCCAQTRSFLHDFPDISARAKYSQPSYRKYAFVLSARIHSSETGLYMSHI